MPRVALTPKVVANQVLTVAPGAAVLTMAAAAAGPDFNEFATTGRELLYVRNSGAGAHTITIYAAEDAWNRGGAITAYSIAAGATAVFGPFLTNVFRETGNVVHVDASDPELLLGVVRYP